MARARFASCAAALLVAACTEPQSSRTSDAGGSAAQAIAIEVLATGDLAGDTEPCGCKQRPLGGVSRRAKVVLDRAAARPGRTLVVDGGDHFFRWPVLDPRDVPQARETAKFLAESLRAMNAAALVAGERDLSLGLGELRRLEARSGAVVLGANLVHARSGTAAFAGHTVVERGGVRIGLVGVSGGEGEIFARAGLRIEPADAALKRAAQQARAAGAEVVIALLHLTADDARRALAALDEPLVDLAIAAHDGFPQPLPELIGPAPAALLQPGERGKWVLSATLEVSPGKRGVERSDAVEVATQDLAAVDRRIAEVKAEGADPALLGRLERRRAQLESERAAIETGRHHRITAELIHLDTALPDDPAVARAYAAYQQRLKVVNAERAAEAAKAGLVYTGSASCKSCHEAAFEHWRTTAHARAWETMVRTKQTGNLDCIGCHTTGFDRPGGPSGLKGLGKFVGVGCESCHGPGALHVKTPTVTVEHARAVPEAVCTECHKIQGDQKPFSFEARLPQVLGPGHGQPAPTRR